MRRLHLIEFHEQPWFPTSIRNSVTDALQFGLNLAKAYAPIAPLLQGALDSTHSNSIVDLCSGAGGPWLDLSPRLHGNQPSGLQILLTDKFPNLTTVENLSAAAGNHITFYPHSVDATKVPRELKGIRTIFTSFHHFPPEEARAVLRDAVNSHQSIGVFEITRRAPLTIALMFPWALLLFVGTPWMRPFRWSRLLWTFLIPVIPFVLLFDGIVSCLRTYRPQELRAIVEKLSAPGYAWQIGEYAKSRESMPITYLIGSPLE
jgi:hypothetical protein